MVLALSLPIDLPLRQLLMAMIFAVVIFSLLVQGLSIKMVLRKLGLIRGDSQQSYETRKGEVFALGRVQLELEQMVGRGLLTQSNYELLAPRLQDRVKELHMDLEEAAAEHQNAVAEELHLAEERLLHAEKDGIKEAYLAGIVSEKVMKKLLSQVDERLFFLEISTKKRGSPTDPQESV
jgi:CPA1 family monovalent cation:H+ antiporter